MKRMYAFRTFSPPLDPRNRGTLSYDTSSAEWHEGTALELGDRVSEAYFFEMMWQAEATEPFPYGWRPVKPDIIAEAVQSNLLFAETTQPPLGTP